MLSSIGGEYEPYTEEVVNIDLKGNELCSLPNGTKDELIVENNRVKINKKIGKVVLNGTQSIGYSSVINDDKFVAQFFNIGTAIKVSSTMISDKFTYKLNGWSSNAENISTGGSRNNLVQIKILQSGLEEISNKIENLIEKYNSSTKLTQTQKEKIVSQLEALQEMIKEIQATQSVLDETT